MAIDNNKITPADSARAPAMAMDPVDQARQAEEARLEAFFAEKQKDAAAVRNPAPVESRNPTPVTADAPAKAEVKTVAKKGPENDGTIDPEREKIERVRDEVARTGNIPQREGTGVKAQSHGTSPRHRTEVARKSRKEREHLAELKREANRFHPKAGGDIQESFDRGERERIAELRREGNRAHPKSAGDPKAGEMQKQFAKQSDPTVKEAPAHKEHRSFDQLASAPAGMNWTI